MLDKNLVYAIVGASNNQEKYGYKVFKDLNNSGYKVIPINLKEKVILGKKVYSTLKEVTETIDVAVFVVPPKATELVLPIVKQLNINLVWMQPGSESETAIKFCADNGIKCVHNMCVMIEKNT